MGDQLPSSFSCCNFQSLAYEATMMDKDISASLQKLSVGDGDDWPALHDWARQCCDDCDLTRSGFLRSVCKLHPEPIYLQYLVPGGRSRTISDKSGTVGHRCETGITYR